VAKEWTERTGAICSEVVLMRYSDGRRKALETNVIGENTAHVYYSSTTQGFSVFAIATPVAKGLNFINLSISLTYDSKHLGEHEKRFKTVVVI